MANAGMAGGRARRSRVWITAAALLSVGVARAQDVRASKGEWSPVWTWPVSATHTVLLPTGKVLVMGEFEEGHRQYLFDPGSNTLSELHHAAGHNAFCAGHSRLADGRILFTGGHLDAHVGLRDAVLLDGASLTWTRLAPMRDPRWYPTNVTLANGEVLVLSGEMNGSGDISDLPEIFDPATSTFRALDTARMRLPYYPRCFVAPDARVFCAGPAKLSRWFDPRGAGKWTSGPRSLYGDTPTTRDYGSAAMIGSKVYIFGGDDPPTETNEVIDLSAASPAFRYVAPFSRPRRQHNAVVIPDGRVIVLGGSSGAGFDNGSAAVLEPDLYDPAADAFTPLAPTSEYRGYHSTALLLPDGRILVGGGRAVHTAQTYSPPYLFRGRRPLVTSAPTTLALGERFRVETPDAAAVRQVTLIRAGAVTHAYDQDQRFVELAFEAAPGALLATAPASNALAPPGDYLLFAVDGDGVPSVGRFVRLGQQAWSPPPAGDPIVVDPQPPAPDPDDHGAPGGGAAAPEPPASPSGGGCASGGGGGGLGALAGAALALGLAAASRRRLLRPALARR